MPTPEPEPHVGCILAIVGSRDCHAAAAVVIEEVLDEHKPIMVISGGAKANVSSRMRRLVSVDETAAMMARQLAIPVVEFLPTTFKFHGAGGFAERNMKIAETCVCLVRIASETTTTYGSGWTADRAEELGKDVHRYIVKSDGSIVRGVLRGQG